MKIPFLDLHKVNLEIEDKIQKAIAEVLSSGWYILGKSGEHFEANLKSALVGDEEGYVIGCNSGTDALILSLLAAGVKDGDEVITVSLTAIPTVTAICAVGAIPVFVDVDPLSWVLDPYKVRRTLTDKTKAIVAVHLYGNMVNVYLLKNMLEEAGRGDVSIIEDVAQGQGASLAGRQAGTIGRFGAFSFYPSKNIGALGDAGAVFCRDRTDMEKIKMLRNYGQKDRYHSEIRRSLNSRLDEIQAAILNTKLPYLYEWNMQKAGTVKRYREAFEDLPIAFQKVTEGCQPGWHLCVIALDGSQTRDLLMSYLMRRGVQTLIHYPIPNHLQMAFRTSQRLDLTLTEKLADRILSLPLNSVITDNEVSYIIESVRSFYP